MDPTTKVVLLIVGAILLLVTGGGGVLWVVRATVTATVQQNKKLVETMVMSSQSQVQATKENTEATVILAGKIDRYIAVGDERNRNMSKQLDRIETAAVRRRRGDPDAT